MQLPKIIEVKGTKVLTTKQIAEAYGVKSDIIGYNFRYNKERYIEGKHYIMLEKQALREFKLTNVEIQRSLPKISKLYLWTEKGALLHAKSLNTDKAWQVYDYLVDFYFRAKENKPEPPAKPAPVPRPMIRQVVDVPENPEILNAIQKIKDDFTCMSVLLDSCKMYISEDEYIERRKSAEGVVPILITDWRRLQDLKPGIIQKQY